MKTLLFVRTENQSAFDGSVKGTSVKINGDIVPTKVENQFKINKGFIELGEMPELEKTGAFTLEAVFEQLRPEVARNMAMVNATERRRRPAHVDFTQTPTLVASPALAMIHITTSIATPPSAPASSAVSRNATIGTVVVMLPPKI